MTGAQVTELAGLVAAGPGGWRREAVCRETDPDAFFPERGGSSRPAKRVCARCPVRQQCLAAALAGDERHGVWGGLTPAERLPLRRRRARAGGPSGRWVA